MKILCVIDSLGSGGAQRQMVTLALGMKERGHKAEFFIYYPQYNHFAPALEKSGIVIHQFQKVNRFSVKIFLVLRRLIRRGKYNVIISFLNTPNFYIEIAGMGIRSPVLIVSERLVYMRDTLAFNEWMMQQCHRLADHITVNSHHQRVKMEQKFSWMKKKVTTIFNGVDLGLFAFQSTRKSIQAPGVLRLLAIGTITSRKNVIGLVQALAEYKKRFNVAPLIHWAGKRDRTVQGEKYYMDVCSLLERLGVADSWEWLGERSDMPALLHKYDAVIHPSFYEGLPNAVCEALAAGRPVLASNVCDNSKLVQDGISGYLFDPTKPEDIAAAIHKIASLTHAARKEMGWRARMFAERELSNVLFIDRYEELFESLTEDRL